MSTKTKRSFISISGPTFLTRPCLSPSRHLVNWIGLGGGCSPRFGDHLPLSWLSCFWL